MFGGSSNYPHFSPVTFWLSKVELVVNNVINDSLFPVVSFIAQQLYYEDKDRE